MIEGIPVVPAGLGAFGLMCMVAILVGRLVPRRNIDDVLHDRDEWRAAHRISESARVEQQQQVDELLEHARTTDALIRAIKAPKGPE